jgi:hypothetical protein
MATGVIYRAMASAVPMTRAMQTGFSPFPPNARVAHTDTCTAGGAEFVQIVTAC